ncbi:MAG: hypothetical protein ACKO2G_05165 [Verrucomicrobiales bacterium]
MRPVRLLLHLCLLVLLVVAVGWLWKNAWAVSEKVSRITLDPGPQPPGRPLMRAESVDWDGSAGTLTLRADQGLPSPSYEIPLQGWPEGSAAHIRFRGVAKEIVPGDEIWQSARIMVIWRDEKGILREKHYGLLFAYGSGTFENEFLAVLNEPGEASIFLQQAGKSGEIVLHSLEICPVTMRTWVPWATAGLLMGVGVWWTFLFRLLIGQSGIRRPLGAATLALVVFWALVLPGPWEPLRPLGGPFAIDHTSALATKPASSIGEPTAESPSAPNTPVAASPVPAVNLPVPAAVKDGWFWETYRWAKEKARGLMHLGTFVALTLAFVAIFHSTRGWIPVAILGISSEAMQTAFGFGFEGEDMEDLAVNALGIGCGLLMVAMWRKWRNGQPKKHGKITSPPCPGAPPESS